MRHRPFVCATFAGPLRIEAGKEGQRLVLAERKPGVTRAAIVELARLGEASERHEAAVLDAQIPLPVGEPGMADVGRALVGLVGRRVLQRRQAPACEDYFALALGVEDDDRCQIIGIDSGKRRQVADLLIEGLSDLLDRVTIAGHGIEVAHGSILPSGARIYSGPLPALCGRLGASPLWTAGFGLLSLVGVGGCA